MEAGKIDSVPLRNIDFHGIIADRCLLGGMHYAGFDHSVRKEPLRDENLERFEDGSADINCWMIRIKFVSTIALLESRCIRL